MKQTEKLRKAEQLYQQLGLKEKYSNQEQLYNLLIANNYFWESDNKRWSKGEAADPPSELIRIRVWAASDVIESVAEILAEALPQYDLKLIEKSKPYVCRPPKQNEHRIYLIFEDKNDTVSLEKRVELKPKPYDVVLGGK